MHFPDLSIDCLSQPLFNGDKEKRLLKTIVSCILPTALFRHISDFRPDMRHRGLFVTRECGYELSRLHGTQFL